MKVKHKKRENRHEARASEDVCKVRNFKNTEHVTEESVLKKQRVSSEGIVDEKHLDETATQLKVKKSKSKKRENTIVDDRSQDIAESDIGTVKKKEKKHKEKDKRKANKYLIPAEASENLMKVKNDTTKVEKPQHEIQQGVNEAPQIEKTKRRRKKKKKLFNKRNKYLHLILPNLNSTTANISTTVTSSTAHGKREKEVNLKVPLKDGGTDAILSQKRKRKRNCEPSSAVEPASKKVKVVGQPCLKDVQFSGTENESEQLPRNQNRRKKKKLRTLGNETMEMGMETENLELPYCNRPIELEQLTRNVKHRKKKKLRDLSISPENQSVDVGTKTGKKKRSRSTDMVEPKSELPIKKVKTDSPSVLSRENVYIHNGERVENECNEQPKSKRKQKRYTSDPSYITEKSKTLKDRMVEKLSASRFRYLNEQLYSMTGKEAFELFHNDQLAYEVYHNGFKNQVAKWPMNPLDVIIKSIKSKPSSLIIADFGCGDAELCTRVKNTVHSFDLVAVNESVVACDMSKVPLKSASVDTAVFCLALMGTNIIDYIAEAHRVLKYGGTLKIAEVESRFRNVDHFVKAIQKLGFTLLSKDLNHDMFVFFDFEKSGQFHRKLVSKLKLNPCMYKKR